MARRKNKKSRKMSLYTIGALIILLIMLLVSYATYIHMNSNIDKNVIKETNDNDDKMEIAPGGGSASLEYSDQVAINKKEQKINLYIKNRNKSRENISIKLFIEDKVIGESQIIPAGYLIKELTLKDTQISEGDYKGYIMVYFYNEETNQKEIVDSKIKVDINVK